MSSFVKDVDAPKAEQIQNDSLKSHSDDAQEYGPNGKPPFTATLDLEKGTGEFEVWFEDFGSASSDWNYCKTCGERSLGLVAVLCPFAVLMIFWLRLMYEMGPVL